MNFIFVVWYDLYLAMFIKSTHCYTANVNRARSGQRITSLGKESDLPSFHITRTRVIITPWQTPRRRLNSSRKNNNNRSKRQSCQRKPSVSLSRRRRPNPFSFIASHRLPFCQVKNAGQPFCVPRKYQKVWRWFSQGFPINEPVCHFSFRTIPCPWPHNHWFSVIIEFYVMASQNSFGVPVFACPKFEDHVKI